MRKHHLLMGVSALGIMIGAASAALAAGAIPADVTASLKNYGRPQPDLYRDKNLMPGEVMAWTGIKSGMEVAEIMPENGYWTRILSGIVGAKGHVYMDVLQARNAKPEKDMNQNEPYSRLVNANAVRYQPEYHDNVMVLWDALNAFPEHFNMPKQLDAVVMAGDYATIKTDNPKWDMTKGNTSIFRAIKNGGVYIIIGAAANKGAGFTQAAMGRVDPDAVKAEVLAAGFVLDGESNILSRPNDPHTGQADDKSDMFILRFKKPANAPNTDKRPKDVKTAMGTQLDSTRGSNPGLIRRKDTGNDRERHVLYHGDMTYQEWGQRGSGNNPWQSGNWFFNADGGSCMIHEFPTDQQGFVNCGYVMPPNNVKKDDLWVDDGGGIYRMLGAGKVEYKDEDATEGGTLGDSPEEKARNFGKILAFAEKNNVDKDYINEYITAYHHFRTESGANPDALDKEFTSQYGKPVPAMPAPKEGRQD